MSHPSYYRPFTTSNEVVEDSDSESVASSFSDSASRSLDDPRYAIIRAAGPSLNTVSDQFFYQSLQQRPQYVIGCEYDGSNNFSNFFSPRYPLLPFVPASKKTLTSLFSFTSTNRDTSVFPLSTFFTIKTPRVYKNITNIQITNINFPNFLNSLPDPSAVFAEVALYASTKTGFSFNNCYSCLGNRGGGRGLTTSLNGGSFSEAGRTNPVANQNPLVHTFTLRGGTYDSMSLANEMDKQMNTTPPFNIISYAQHRELFLSTGSVSHLFNDPGKWYCSPLTGQYIRNATKSLIINDYLPTTTIAGIQPTEKETFVAYFYPVLKAAFYSAYDSKFLDLGSAIDVQNRVLTTFEGLSSSLYYDLCYRNLSTLKSIRRVHTFEYNPINSYNYTYSPSTNKMSVSHTELHPSLQKDIQTFHQTSRLSVASDMGYSSRDLTALQTRVSASASVLTDLTKQLQSALVEVGVPRYTLTNDQLANLSTPLLLQSKKSLMAVSEEDALIGLTVDRSPSSLSPPGLIKRSFPAAFGWSTLGQLVQDASNALVAQPGSRAFTQPYLAQLNTANQVSQMTHAGSFVNRLVQGTAVSCSDLPSLYSTFVNYYSTNTGLATTASAIQSKSLVATSNYVNAKYGSVFPPALLENNAYLNGTGTGAVTFYSSKSLHYPSTPDDSNHRNIRAVRGGTDTSDCCGYINAILENFYGCLPAEYITTTPFYQLGYGINDILSLYTTNTLSQKTVANNIYLQMNPEQSLNNMDTAGNENYNIANQSMGEYKKVFGKLLLQGLTAGQVCQTIVQIPATFPTAPLASLDHFSFNFLLDTMVPLSALYPFVFTGTDWNAIIQVDEQVGAFNPNP